MNVELDDHTLEVTGNWTGKWLFLAPEYELWVDGDCVDRLGGPRTRPVLEATYEGSSGEIHHVEARIFSIVGFRPRCTLAVEGDVVSTGRVPVENFLNPFLILVILISTGIMLYVGPDVIEQFLPV